MIAADQFTDGKLIELPPEAGDVNQPRFEPEDDWLRQAPADLQQAAMWRWMATHYDDPVTATPHDSEGNFDFFDNDPCLADQVLAERFEGVVSKEVLRTFIGKVQSEAGNEWVVKVLDKLSS